MDDYLKDDGQSNRHKRKKRRSLSPQEKAIIHLKHLVIFTDNHPDGVVVGLPDDDQPPRPFATFKCEWCGKHFLLDYMKVWNEQVSPIMPGRRRGDANLCQSCHERASREYRLGGPRWIPPWKK